MKKGTHRVVSVMVVIALGLILYAVSSTNPRSDGPSHEVVKKEPFVFYYSATPTPLPDAATRYGNFVYHLQKVGESRDIEIPAASVTPTKDQSVLAKFEMVMSPWPQRNDPYEAWVTYTLDGKPRMSPIHTTKLIASLDQSPR